MAVSRKIPLALYADTDFRNLSAPQPNGQSLYLWLLTSPLSSTIPGIIRSGAAGMAEHIGWPPDRWQEAFAEVWRNDLAEADFDTHLVWVPAALADNKPQSPNVVRSWARDWPTIPDSPLKLDVYEALRTFVQSMGQSYLKAFDERCGKPVVTQAQQQAWDETLARRQAQQRSELPPGHANWPGRYPQPIVKAGTVVLEGQFERTPAEDDTDDTVFTRIPLKDGTRRDVTHAQVASYAKLFPNVDVESELMVCRDWYTDHPAERHGLITIRRHITAWLAEANTQNA